MAYSYSDFCIQTIYSLPADPLATAVQFFQNFLQGIKLLVGIFYDFLRSRSIVFLRVITEANAISHCVTSLSLSQSNNTVVDDE